MQEGQGKGGGGGADNWNDMIWFFWVGLAQQGHQQLLGLTVVSLSVRHAAFTAEGARGEGRGGQGWEGRGKKGGGGGRGEAWNMTTAEIQRSVTFSPACFLFRADKGMVGHGRGR